MRQLFLVVLAASLHLSGQTKDQQYVIRLASAALRPLAYENRQGQVEGFYKDAIGEAARRMGRRAQFSLHQDGLEKTLRANRADVWVAGVGNPARRLEFYFSQPWWMDEIYLLVAEASPVQRQEDLDQLRLGYGEAPPMALPVELAFPKAKWVAMNSVQARLESLCRGELDAALVSNNFLYLFWQSRPAPCKELAFRLVKQDQVRQELSLVSSFSNRDLVDRIYRELVGMMRDGTLTRLAENYPMLSHNSSVVLKSAMEQSKQLILFEVALAGALILLVALWIYLRHLNLQRQRARAALQSAEATSIAKDQFLATLSHEIRTPLNAVAGYLDLLEETLSRPEQRVLAQEVRQSCQALMNMVSEILDYSQLNYGRGDGQTSEFSLAELLEECVSALRKKAEAKGLDLVVFLSPNVPALLCSHPRRVL
jgi:signal transduction histidine kinase